MTETKPVRDNAVEISATDLRRLLDEETDVRLLDVRTPGEFDAGHIPGAVNIPLDQVRTASSELARGKGNAIVLVCQTSGRASSAREILAGAGCTELAVLTGGMNAWSATDGQTATRPGRWTLERQVRLVAGAMVVVGVALSLVWEPAKFLAGAVGAGLVFASVTNTCAMGMLLGKLPYNRGRSCDIDAAVCGLTRTGPR